MNEKTEGQLPLQYPATSPACRPRAGCLPDWREPAAPGGFEDGSDCGEIGQISEGRRVRHAAGDWACRCGTDSAMSMARRVRILAHTRQHVRAPKVGDAGVTALGGGVVARYRRVGRPEDERMADAQSPEEPLLFTCTHHVDEPGRATVPFAAVTAVEALANGKWIARGR